MQTALDPPVEFSSEFDPCIDMPVKPEKPDIKRWIEFIVFLLVFGGGIVWAGHHELDQLDTRLEKIERRLDKFDSALRILSNAQNGDTKSLINEILAQAKEFSNAGRKDSALKFLAAANKLTDSVIIHQTTAPPSFFEQATLDLVPMSVDAQLRPTAFSTQTKLAEYRSALLPVPSVSGSISDCNHVHGAIGFANYSGEFRFARNGGVLNCDHQLLDNVGWVDWVFVNTHIEYRGGPLLLKNVKFVNCTFEVGVQQPAYRFLQYVALDQNDLSYRAPKEDSGL
jgi:hypothetical protein